MGKLGYSVFDFEAGESNPGQRLYDLITSFYISSEFGGLLEQISSDLKDDELINYVFNSHINLIVRRLIQSAQYIKRVSPRVNNSQLRSSLQDHLETTTRYRTRQIQLISNILLDCLDAIDDDIGKQIRKNIKIATKNGEYLCYICGRPMSFEKVVIDSNGQGDTNDETKKKLSTIATLDHIWPHSMGGSSRYGNLRYACAKCNNVHKGDHINGFDYHYEFMALKFRSSSDYYSETSNRNRVFETAVLAKTDFCCSVCNVPAYRAGELRIGRRELDDSFHFGNLLAYCDRHMPKGD